MLVISEKEIQQSYGMKDAISDVKAVLRAHGARRIDNPHRTVLDFLNTRHRHFTCQALIYLKKFRRSKLLPFFQRILQGGWQQHKESSCCQMQKMANI